MKHGQSKPPDSGKSVVEDPQNGAPHQPSGDLGVFGLKGEFQRLGRAGRKAETGKSPESNAAMNEYGGVTAGPAFSSCEDEGTVAIPDYRADLFVPTLKGDKGPSRTVSEQ